MERNQIVVEAKGRIMHTVSLTLSAVFSPLLIPTYAYLLAIWLSVLAYAPEKARLMSALTIFIICTVLPLVAIAFLMRIGKVSDSAIENKSERTLPFLVTVACYIASAVYLMVLHAPGWLYAFYWGAAAIAVISLIINHWWKISAHAGSMGGLCGALYFLGIEHLSITPMLWWIIGAIILSGAVCTARVYLGRHTLGQVFAGWTLGAVTVTLMMSLI